MSGQPAEHYEERRSTDSRLDSILDQLNALGGSGSALGQPKPTLRSVPDFVPEDEHVDPVDHVEPVDEPETMSRETVVPEMPPLPPPILGLVPPPLEVPPIPAPTPPPIPEPVDTPPLAATIETPPLATSIEPPVEVEQAPETNFTFAASEVTETAEPAPLVVEYHEPSPEPPSPAPVSDDELVFVLDGPLDEEMGAVAEPLANPEPFTVGEPSAHVPVDVDQPSVADSDPGWVSHHEEPVAAPVEEMVAPALTDTADTTETSTFEAPQWAEINEDPDLRGDDPTAAGAASALPTPARVIDEETEQFSSDEELPLPDFTGVWDDSGDLGVWDDDASSMGGVPDPVEAVGAGSGISVGRNELDSLRPAEEEKVAKPPAQNLGRKLQLFAVILFGLIALAVVLLNDPAVVAELREIYDGFFG